MKKHYIYSSDSLKPEGIIKGNLKMMGLYRVFIIISVFLTAFGVFQIIEENNRTERIYSENESKVTALEDTIRNLRDSMETMVEINNLHSIIGKIVIEKPSKKHKAHAPSKNDVWNFINECKPWYPEYIMAQAVLESSCGATSPKGTNNMFGMKIPNRRETTALNVGTMETYAKYAHWKLSVTDRILWEIFTFKGHKPSKDEYLKSLNGYAEDPAYLKKLENIASVWHSKSNK